MKAVAVTPAKRRIDLVDRPEPSLGGPHDAKLEMLDVGICGTDREISSFEYGTPPPGEELLLIGHESLGRVVEVGREVTRVRPGDLVVTIVRRPAEHAGCVVW